VGRPTSSSDVSLGPTQPTPASAKRGSYRRISCLPPKPLRRPAIRPDSMRCDGDGRGLVSVQRFHHPTPTRMNIERSYSVSVIPAQGGRNIPCANTIPKRNAPQISRSDSLSVGSSIWQMRSTSLPYVAICADDWLGRERSWRQGVKCGFVIHSQWSMQSAKPTISADNSGQSQAQVGSNPKRRGRPISQVCFHGEFRRPTSNCQNFCSAIDGALGGPQS
jgi:hypothetical protein